MMTLILIVFACSFLLLAFKLLRFCFQQIFGFANESAKTHLGFYTTMLYYRLVAILGIVFLIVLGFIVSVTLIQSKLSFKNYDSRETIMIQMAISDGQETIEKELHMQKDGLIHINGKKYKLIEKQKLHSNGSFRIVKQDGKEYCLVRKK